jgi:NitT/TauT family transport system substrate-binding protein
MKMRLVVAAVALALVCSAGQRYADAQTNLRVGWCARTLSSAAAPFAIASKMGWFAAEGITVQLLPLPGSTDCVKLVATGEVIASLPSVEPVAIIHAQGVKIRTFYTAYQGNIYGFAVPANSPITRVQDLKGKKIGVISMASAGVLVARALASANGMNPDSDIKIVVAGEGAQTAALIRSNQVDALSQFDTQYAMVENAGVPLRRIETPDLDRFPSNGFIALESSMERNRKELIGLARGYAKGTIFAINNPEAAMRILWEVYPQTRATGKDEATALHDDIRTLEARAVNWKLDKAKAKRWGENVTANYEAYLEFLLKWDVIKQAVPATDIVFNGWLDEIDRFDANQLAAEARAYRYSK